MKSTADFVNTSFFQRLFFAALFVFSVIALLVFIVQYTQVDGLVMQAISTSVNDKTTQFMRGITFLGNHQFLIPANVCLIIVLFFYKQKKWAVCTLLTSLTGVGLMSLLKKAFGRRRPPASLVEGITNNAFPSGHAMMSLLFYGLLILLSIKFLKNKLLKISAILLITILVLLIGYSRLYLRVHFTTDVLAGYSLGLCWLSCCIIISEKIMNRK